MKLRLQRPWLIADLPGMRRVASWALNRPGFTDAERIVWREVRNADLPPELDARNWLTGELATAGLVDAVCLLTSRDIGAHVAASATIDGERVDAVATVGLGNAERVGMRMSTSYAPGTINIAVATSSPLSDGALLEAMSVATEARTLALLDAELATPGGAATGTGTDCVVVAAASGGGSSGGGSSGGASSGAAPSRGAAHAGKHTAIGEAIGRATLDVVRTGVAHWLEEQRRVPPR